MQPLHAGGLFATLFRSVSHRIGHVYSTLLASPGRKMQGSLSPFLLSPREHSRSRFEAFSLATTALVRTFSSVLIVGVESRERAVWFACRPAARCSAVPSVFCGPRGRNKIPLRIPLEVLLTPETVGFQGISDKSTSLPRLKGFA